MVEGRWQLGTVLSCLPWPDLWSVRSRLASKTQLSSWIQWLRAVCCPGRLLHTFGLLRASRPLKEGAEGVAMAETAFSCTLPRPSGAGSLWIAPLAKLPGLN